jgi:patched domain-containing protein
MFIIYASFKRTTSWLETNVRIAKTLENVGVSITITSLTDFVAFIVGYFTDFKSIQIFCIYAGLCRFYNSSHILIMILLLL